MSRPLRRDAERNRQRILEAAAEVFAARGLEVTLDDIAKHAGLGVGTVYRRFPSREHLVEALFEHTIDEIADLAEASLREPDPWTALTEFMFRTAELQTANAGLRQVMLSSAYGHDRVARARERLIPAAHRMVARAQADGSLRADLDPTDIPLIEFMIGSTADYTGGLRPQLWRRFLTIVLDGLRVRRDEPTELPEPALGHDALADAMNHWKPGRQH
ncbi:TetR/AcrR family transcriptional regulator [Amycolatopsis anabasis]|uniref:TetR/AcrR family transcriptional regulator n=1 Tax=Amycolatopsis anabasis TaxID=1840409 RepID=UPI00131C8BD1|nr:TetR/AcrR family transcriptional regulator [Amycolatopsis anabasis]